MKPLSVGSCCSDFRELLLGLGVVEYFGGHRIKRRSSSFLIQRSSLVMAVMAQALVTSGLKQGLYMKCLRSETPTWLTLYAWALAIRLKEFCATMASSILLLHSATA
ncbi:hypothetical protein CRUP_022047 [Coryphaenoides rupestris]|nr:hypothetical protein CRUP_022047 [Coryphaenoides rupestris]